MRICVFGAGAIGGYLGALLSRAGHDVSLVARGAHLAAMQRHGLRLRMGGEELVARPRCVESPAELGAQDYVLVTLKAHALSENVERLLPLLGPDTAVVHGANGIPWWYFHGLDGPWRDRRLESVDPGGRQWDCIGPERAIGCVVYPACEVVEPGVVQHVSEDKLAIGEPSGERTARARALCDALVAAGLRAPLRPQIRNEIWVKLWGNLSFNPISALTLATLEEIATDPGTRALARAMMLEAQVVAEKLGVRFPIDVERRIEGARAVGAHRTSMLQDLELGRPLEIDALLGAVHEMGRIVETPTPTIDAVLALVRQRARHGVRALPALAPSDPRTAPRR
jgi:2-dehydropantoate 2-reductase